jgi:hypothetical protein
MSMGLIALVLVAFVFGAMVFFAAVVTPVLFRRLSREAAGEALRRLFPAYYMTLGCAAAAAAVVYAVDASPASFNAMLLAAVAAGFFLARFVLLPRIDAARPAPGEASPHFSRLHRFSVVLNLAQLLVMLYVLVTL